MRKTVFCSLVSGLFLASPIGAAWAQSPMVVELYQSQGCSSCPPAIRNVNGLADRSGLLVLMFAVTYWDRLGWKDTFAKPEFTARQYDYSHGMGRTGVYTPQVIINGAADLVGADAKPLQTALRRAAPLQGPDIAVTQNTVSVAAAATTAAADVWLVRYDPGTVNVAIGAGENSGVTIAHRNVVRTLVRLGTWQGAAQTYPLAPSANPAWRTAILVQQKNGGSILSATTD